MSIDVTVIPPAGDPIVLDPIGAAGALGSNGWTPVLAVANDGARRVFKVVDWAGGEDTKPAVGDYVGAGSTLVSDITQAVDVRGPIGPQGAQGDPGQILTSGSIFTGNGAPSSGLGVDNDIYIDNITANLYQKQSGVWVLQTNIKGAKGDKGDTGDVGTPGNAGTNGATILIGSGVPASGLGIVGDVYIENTTFSLYQKTGSAVWTTFGTFRGAAGSSIRVAAGAPSNTLGADGDSYVNASNGDLYVRTAGTYTVSGNIKGPQGNTGGTGATGATGSAGADGQDILNGTTDPASGVGADGDSYVNTTSFHYFTKSAGAWTDRGSIKGQDGIGNAFYTGPSVPGTIPPSIPGDIFINTSNGDVYQKVGVSWGSPIMNIRGPQGTTGATGAAGSQGPQGTAGTSILNGTGAPSNSLGNNGDSYINRTNGDLYGPKASGAWPSPPLSLVGPQGASGATGSTGAAGSNGSNFLSGAGAPASGLGSNGDTYLNVSTGDLYGPKSAGAWGSIVGSLKGSTGATGGTGAAGSNGTNFLSGSGVPASGLGVNGDTYLNTATGDLYGPKSAGSWGSIVGSLKGPTGSTGATGSAGATGSTGAAGSNFLSGAGIPSSGLGANGDTYLNVSTGDVYGPKSAGAWGSIAGSLKGPTGSTGSTGSTGAAGTRGSVWYTGAGVPTAQGGQLAGDIYLRTGNGEIYTATSTTAWSDAGFSIQGPQGLTGSTGSTGSTGAAGPTNLPQNSQSTNYTTVLADAGKHIFHPAADTTARTYTIDHSVGYAVGDSISFINEHGAGVITIAIANGTSPTLRFAGGSLTGSRTLAADGMATAVKVSTSTWYINGAGLT